MDKHREQSKGKDEDGNQGKVGTMTYVIALQTRNSHASVTIS